MWRFADGADHVLGDRQPHPVVRDVLRVELARLRGGGFADIDHRRRSDRTVDVLASDSAVAAGPRDARRVDPVLKACAADGGAEAVLYFLARPERSRRALL